MTNNWLSKTSASSRVLLGLAIALGIVFNCLFFQTWVGVNIPLFAGGLIIAYALMVHIQKIRPSRETLALMTAVIFFTLMVAVRANEFLLFLNIATSLLLLVLIVDQTNRAEGRKSILDYILPFIAAPFVYIAKASTAVREATVEKQKNTTKLKEVLKGVLMAIPVLLVFSLLFASADLVILEYLKKIFNFEYNPEILIQILIVIIISIIVAGALRHTIETQKKERSWVSIDIKRTMGSTSVAVFLGLISALFLVFSIIQITYLFGGANNLEQLGFTYAEYARKGFGELIVIALLTFGLIWLAEKSVKREKDTHTFHFKALSALLVVETLGILGSSFYRLFLYEQAFGFTLPRFYAHTFVIWLGVVFLLFLYMLFVEKHKKYFLKSIFHIAIVFLVGINLINPDVFVAKHNIQRAHIAENRGFDVYYLTRVSDDAIEEKLFMISNASPLDDISRQVMGQHLFYELTMSRSEYGDKWQSQNLARSRATQRLHEERATIEQLHTKHEERFMFPPFGEPLYESDNTL